MGGTVSHKISHAFPSNYDLEVLEIQIHTSTVKNSKYHINGQYCSNISEDPREGVCLCLPCEEFILSSPYRNPSGHPLPEGIQATGQGPLLIILLITA